MISFNSFPIIETDNLILRRMNHNDANDLFEMRNDERMNSFTDSIPDKEVSDTIKYIDIMNKGIDQDKWIIWAMVNKSLNKVIGSISIWNLNIEEQSGELGFGIMPSFQRKGFMKESLIKVIEYGFKVINLKIIYAYTEVNNISSIKLLESCNFKLSGRIVEKGYLNNRDYDMAIYKLDNNIKF